mmetsp:Transcript_59104/g.105465  ORF Transcript_59104/g.105465 Transcript_59104/m.105465 type:complete len:227 (+) Transcript_59104:1086-1766(+)
MQSRPKVRRKDWAILPTRCCTSSTAWYSFSSRMACRLTYWTRSRSRASSRFCSRAVPKGWDPSLVFLRWLEQKLNDILSNRFGAPLSFSRSSSRWADLTWINASPPSACRRSSDGNPPVFWAFSSSCSMAFCFFAISRSIFRRLLSHFSSSRVRCAHTVLNSRRWASNSSRTRLLVTSASSISAWYTARSSAAACSSAPLAMNISCIPSNSCCLATKAASACLSRA